MAPFGYTQTHHDTRTRARVGVITTPHGAIETPAFVPVGTQATVKSLTPEELNTLGVQLFFVNTYHMFLRPGVEVIKKFNGLHAFMGWNGPLITDSGGFQVFSLGHKRYVNIAISESAVSDRQRFGRKKSRQEAAQHQVYPDDYRPVGELVKIDEDGVTFTSHWDGSHHVFTPETSIEVQQALGADILLAFDECAPYPTTHGYAKKAMERTHRWAERSLQHFHRASFHSKHRQALYGVVQGSVYEDLRKESAKCIRSLDFSGIAIGGVSVGESKAQMRHVLEWVVPLLPDKKPRHLLGVGEIDDIFALVQQGIDTFDCVQPTRLARMGHLFTRAKLPLPSSTFTIDITKKSYAEDTKPIEPDCRCYTCQHFSRAYLRHLYLSDEMS